MKQYLLPFAVYVLSLPLFGLFLSDENSYVGRTILTLGLLLYYYKQFKLKFKFEGLGVIVGLLGFGLWMLFDDVMLTAVGYVPANAFYYVIKFVGLLLVAPFVEELFIRDFFNRLIISNDWKKVPIGKFNYVSFVVTALFFGFAHSQWLSGLIFAIVMNLLLMRTKRIESCIVGHMVANLVLGVYVVMTGSFGFW